MAFMAWTDELLTGIDQVDEQHKWLVATTNRLHDELAKPSQDTDSIGNTLFDLVDYAYNHFIMEEELFQRLGYPDMDAQKAQHNDFTDKLTALLQRHERKESLTAETAELLRQWLVQHILADKNHTPFLKSKGAG